MVMIIFIWQAKSVLTKPENQKDNAVLVAYAARFLKHNNYNIVDNQAAVPMSPDRVSDLGILDLSWEDNLTEVWNHNQCFDVLFIFLPFHFLLLSMMTKLHVFYFCI